jgi:hypothetical protein
VVRCCSGRCLQQRGHSRKVERASVPSSASYITLGPGPRHSTRTAPFTFPCNTRPWTLATKTTARRDAHRCMSWPMHSQHSPHILRARARSCNLLHTVFSPVFVNSFRGLCEKQRQIQRRSNHVTKRLWSHHEIFESLCSRDNLDCTTLQ